MEEGVENDVKPVMAELTKLYLENLNQEGDITFESQIEQLENIISAHPSMGRNDHKKLMQKILDEFVSDTADETQKSACTAFFRGFIRKNVTKDSVVVETAVEETYGGIPLGVLSEDGAERQNRKKAKFDSKLAYLTKQLDRTEIASEIKIPAGLVKEMPIVYEIISDACKNLGINVLVDASINIAPGSVLHGEVWKKDSALKLATIRDEVVRKSITDLLSLLAGIESFIPADKMVKTLGSIALQRMFAVAWQKLVYDNDLKSTSRALQGNKDTMVNLNHMLNRIVPTLSTFGQCITGAINTIVEHAIIRVIALQETEEELFDDVSKIIKSYYISNQGLVSRCFHRANRRRVKKDVADRKKNQPKWKPREEDKEDYTAIVKPKIDFNGFITSPGEEVSLKSVNRDLQRLEGILALKVTSLNYTENIEKVTSALTLIHTKCKAVESFLAARKQIAYNDIWNDQDADIDGDDWKPTSSEWSTTIASLFRDGTYGSVVQLLTDTFGFDVNTSTTNFNV